MVNFISKSQLTSTRCHPFRRHSESGGFWTKDPCVQEDFAGVLRDLYQLTESPLSVLSSAPPSWWQEDVLPTSLPLASPQFCEAVFSSRTFLFKADNHNWRTFTWSSLLLSLHPPPSLTLFQRTSTGTEVNKLTPSPLFSCFHERMTRFFENVRQGIVVVVSCVLPSVLTGGWRL